MQRSATYKEIMQQPAIWRGWEADFGAQLAALRAWIAGQNPDEIWLCGAGTSAYIGDLIAAALGADPRRIRAIATTDLVACPQNYMREGLRPLVISFGRSGNSAESLGTLDLLDRFLPEAPRLNITCNAKSAHATRPAKHQKTIILPPATHDMGFAMTSSYSTMLLTALLLLGAMPLGHLTSLAGRAEALLPSFFASAHAMPRPNRAVFTGSGPLAMAAGDIPVPRTGDDAADAVLYVLFAQALAVTWSHALGLHIDDPFRGRGTLTRVVSGVSLHTPEAL